LDELSRPSTSADTTGIPTSEERSFRSAGLACAATLYRPAPRSTNVPCVVMAAGISQTRHDGFPRFAQRFAEAGFAALTFDFRYLGDSEGEPRQMIDFKHQRADLAAAISFARTLPGVAVDQVVVWGFSFGGGHAVHTAARDHGLAAAIALSPFVDGLAFALAGDIRNNLRLMGAAGHATLARRPIRMPLTAPQGKLMLFTQPEASPGFAAVRSEDSTWRNEILAKPSQPAARIRPIRDAKQISCPLLVGVGTDDTMVPTRPIKRLAEQAPHGQLHQHPGGHFDGFLEHFEQVVEAQIAFLTHHLPPARTSE
jgi:dienelactone hydrolase